VFDKRRNKSIFHPRLQVFVARYELREEKIVIYRFDIGFFSSFFARNNYETQLCMFLSLSPRSFISETLQTRTTTPRQIAAANGE
jgi:hypothetical protein